MTISTSLVGASIERARVALVQSARRTLIPIVRPRRPRFASPSQSWRDIRRTTASSSARSETSSSKVVSLE